MKIKAESLLYGTIILTAANFFVRFLGFIYRVLLSRIIGPEGIGIFQLVTPLYFITISLTASGVPVAVSRLIAQRKALGDFRGMRRILFISIGLVGSISIILSILLILNTDWIASHVLREPRTRGALYVYFPCIFIIGMGAVLKGYFYGVKNFRPPAIAEIIEQLVRMGLVITLLYHLSPLGYQESAALAVFGMVIGELASLLYLNYRYYKAPKAISDPGKTPSTLSLLRNIIEISVPITCTRLLASFMISINSVLIPRRLIYGGMAANDAVGLFGILSGMVLPLLFLPFTLTSALSMVMIPNLSESMAQAKWPDIRDKISKAILLTTLTAFPSTALLVSLAYPIGIFLYGQPKVGTLLTPLAFSVVFHALQHTLSSVLNGLGKQNRSALHFIIGGTIQLICTYTLIANPRFGINGFIIGFFASSIVVFTLNLITVLQVTRLQFSFTKWILRPGFSALLMASITRLSYLFLFDKGLTVFVSLALSSLAGVGTFLASLAATGGIPFVQRKHIVSH